jgi:hypothetical protein
MGLALDRVGSELLVERSANEVAGIGVDAAGQGVPMVPLYVIKLNRQTNGPNSVKYVALRYKSTRF